MRDSRRQPIDGGVDDCIGSVANPSAVIILSFEPGVFSA